MKVFKVVFTEKNKTVFIATENGVWSELLGVIPQDEVGYITSVSIWQMIKHLVKKKK